ncbi:PREDICTED: uncharacterized protein LOC109149934 [Ipomoea nil]|uniref:uncharacterized protein LOC109149934 n=1 Tax=Ipomoea nil TaxID=35883 RepID=UPI000901CD07|nr:PREDICTED: uncharacterized protein LOC109149934 [Ipomoea nil]
MKVALTWSDDDEPETDPGSDPDEISGNFVAFTALTTTVPDSITGEESEIEESLSSQVSILENAKKVYLSKISDRDSIIEDSHKQEETLKHELEELKNELEQFKRKIKMMDNTSTLYQILDSGRKTPTKVRGHTKPECFYFYKDQRVEKYTKKSITPFVKQIWVKKSDFLCHVSFHSTSTNRKERWHFDSGCSRHMTGDAKFLNNIKESTREVTFGDEVKGKITGISTLNVTGLPKLKQVLLVEGLHANLISISQLCDQEWKVCFTKDSCNVIDYKKNCVMEGKRSSDNFYILTNDSFCYRSNIKESKLWHQKMGHLNYRSLEKLIKIKGVRGLLTSSFLREKSETVEVFKTLAIKLQKEKDELIIRIRSDHGREFDNQVFDDWCALVGISHEYSAPKTPQQNGIVERKNRTIQEMARDRSPTGKFERKSDEGSSDSEVNPESDTNNPEPPETISSEPTPTPPSTSLEPGPEPDAGALEVAIRTHKDHPTQNII